MSRLSWVPVVVGTATLAVLAAGCTGSADGGASPGSATAGSPVGTDSAGAGGSGGSGAASSGSTAGDTSSGSVLADPNAAYGLPVPRGVRLTRLGTSLRVGQTATVAWRSRPSTVGVLQIRVTRLRQGDLSDFAGFVLDRQTRRSTPYYVDATVRNVGRTDLAGAAVPLVMVDGHGTLVEASRFRSTFTPCSAQPLPARFRHGASESVCMVYLATRHGTLSSVAFRPRAAYSPVTWTGVIQPSAGVPGASAGPSSSASPAGT